jgi:hypothetical protein
MMSWKVNWRNVFVDNGEANDLEGASRGDSSFLGG